MRIFSSILVVLLSGCSLLPVKTEVQVVKIPVAVECPRPTIAAAPVLPIINEQDKKNSEIVLRYQAASFETIQAYAQQLENIISVYQADLLKQVKLLEQKMKEAEGKK